MWSWRQERHRSPSEATSAEQRRGRLGKTQGAKRVAHRPVATASAWKSTLNFHFHYLEETMNTTEPRITGATFSQGCKTSPGKTAALTSLASQLNSVIDRVPSLGVSTKHRAHGSLSRF